MLFCRIWHRRGARSSIRSVFDHGRIRHCSLLGFTETLKAYRTERMWKEHNMYNVPFSDPELREAFNDQLLVT